MHTSQHDGTPHTHLSLFNSKGAASAQSWPFFISLRGINPLSAASPFLIFSNGLDNLQRHRPLITLFHIHHQPDRVESANVSPIAGNLQLLCMFSGAWNSRVLRWGWVILKSLDGPEAGGMGQTTEDTRYSSREAEGIQVNLDPCNNCWQSVTDRRLLSESLLQVTEMESMHWQNFTP